EPRLQANFTIR
nr:Chain C, tRNA (guanine(26)-N(2))-dimethyltransferase [Homo sapiens]